ncbi:MAG: hypothetical protein H0V10_06545 [Geodermatophilaceae bacterium]|nr:hypothetical protein [Geodermatophilaceae bacterium]
MPRRLDEPVDISLRFEDVMTLGGGLRAYLRSWQRHVEEDAGATHSAEEDAEIRPSVQPGWKLHQTSTRGVAAAAVATPGRPLVQRRASVAGRALGRGVDTGDAADNGLARNVLLWLARR